MIKINLLPQRRAKMRVTGADPPSKQLMVGVIGLAVAAAAVALFVDQPRRARLAELTEDNRRLYSQIQAKTTLLEGYDELKKTADDAGERERSIKRLASAKVVPANVLHELGEILTPSRNPKMTGETKNRIASDPNKRFAADWDASHVWLSGWSDTGGVFKLEGGAETESDVTQLAKRLAASVYFTDVTPAGGERVADSQTGTNYYKFTITGKVAY
ncbi:MAG TPA: PilN domain-containing protein [Kofleriaceae bacterium]|jgi:Tfp pilus assembly protein PilN|nr:PilN domain-containing protein [Kofleriaceae bacterium]